jgi:hypothetical protein
LYFFLYFLYLFLKNSILFIFIFIFPVFLGFKKKILVFSWIFTPCISFFLFFCTFLKFWFYISRFSFFLITCNF